MKNTRPSDLAVSSKASSAGSARHDQMYALVQPAPVAPLLGCGRPLAGGADDLPRGNFHAGVFKPILKRRSAHPPALFNDSGQLAIIHAHRAGCHRTRNQFQHQPGIVGLRVPIGKTAFQSDCIDGGKCSGKRILGRSGDAPCPARPTRKRIIQGSNRLSIAASRRGCRHIPAHRKRNGQMRCGAIASSICRSASAFLTSLKPNDSGSANRRGSTCWTQKRSLAQSRCSTMATLKPRKAAS